jgi:hypothetical protein
MNRLVAFALGLAALIPGPARAADANRGHPCLLLVPALSRISYVPVFLMRTALVPLGIGAIHLLSPEIRRVDLPAGPSNPTAGRPRPSSAPSGASLPRD